MNGISRTRKSALLAASALTLVMAVSSGAQAQTPPNCTNTLPGAAGGFDLAGLIPFASGGSVSSLISVLNTTNTAFLTQSSAFIGSPANPQPNEMGGGIWARGIGGRIDTDNTGVTTVGDGGPDFGGVGRLPGNVTCRTTTRTDFTGYQAGADISKLNVGNWNMHWGGTVGYMEADSKDISFPGAGFSSKFQIPFVGIYGAITQGGFFLDGQFRADFYQGFVNDVGANLTNQQFDARGIAVTANTGYNYRFNNGWFVEPSAGVVYSVVHVDPLFAFGQLFTNLPDVTFPGVVQINTVESLLGRASLRVGTTVTSGNLIWQPFATASIFHEFADPVTSDFRTCLFAGLSPGLVGSCQNIFGTLGIDFTSQLTTSRVGTYGQFALGVAGQVIDTGWLGYIRADFRTGENIEGWSVNGGLRYQFTPAQLAAPVGKGLVTKAPPAPVAAPVNWTGFYVGGFAGTTWGRWSDKRLTGRGGPFDPFSDPFGEATPDVSPVLAGVLAGGQVGFNWQFGRLVAGVEADAGWTNATGARPCPNVDVFMTCEYNANYLATAGLRLGYAVDRALFYVKGGAAFTEQEYPIFFNPAAFPLGAPLGAPVSVGHDLVFFAKDTRTGGMVGAGIEVALTQNISAKAEYTYADFGDEQIVRQGIGPLAAGPFPLVNATSTTSDISTQMHAVKVGLNYRFTGFGPSTAADLGTPLPVVAPAVGIDDWSGFYVGLGLGGRWTDTTWTTTCLAPQGGLCFNDAFGPIFASDNPSKFDMSGVRVSGYLGYNWQFGSWLVGVEGDFGWADNKETHKGIPGTFLLASLPALNDTATVEDKWDASIRGRVGWIVLPQLLLYATGGVSWLEKEVSASCAPPEFPVSWCGFIPQNQQASRTYVGWTVGGGLEWKLTRNWLVRGEYRYADYTDDTSGLRFLAGIDAFDFKVDQKTHTALLGVTYLFNFAPEAVAPPLVTK